MSTPYSSALKVPYNILLGSIPDILPFLADYGVTPATATPTQTRQAIQNAHSVSQYLRLPSFYSFAIDSVGLTLGTPARPFCLILESFAGIVTAGKLTFLGASIVHGMPGSMLVDDGDACFSGIRAANQSNLDTIVQLGDGGSNPANRACLRDIPIDGNLANNSVTGLLLDITAAGGVLTGVAVHSGAGGTGATVGVIVDVAGGVGGKARITGVSGGAATAVVVHAAGTSGYTSTSSVATTPQAKNGLVVLSSSRVQLENVTVRRIPGHGKVLVDCIRPLIKFGGDYFCDGNGLSLYGCTDAVIDHPEEQNCGKSGAVLSDSAATHLDAGDISGNGILSNDPQLLIMGTGAQGGYECQVDGTQFGNGYGHDIAVIGWDAGAAAVVCYGHQISRTRHLGSPHRADDAYDAIYVEDSHANQIGTPWVGNLTSHRYHKAVAFVDNHTTAGPNKLYGGPTVFGPAFASYPYDLRSGIDESDGDSKPLEYGSRIRMKGIANGGIFYAEDASGVMQPFLFVDGSDIRYAYGDPAAKLFVIKGDPAGMQNLVCNANGVGTGGVPRASCVLDLDFTTTKALGLMRLTDTQMNAIASPEEGMVIQNTTHHVPYYYNGAAWFPIMHHKHFVTGVVNTTTGATNFYTDGETVI